MNKENDPFVHQPELRGKIADPSKSFFRDFDAADFFAQKPELSWVAELLRSEKQRAESRALALSGKRDSDLWVFAYGSLMWDPALDFQQVRRAWLEGYARHFILKDIYGARGTVERPGLMAALDKGSGCQGLIYKIPKHKIEFETEILWRREMAFPGYIPTFVSVQSGEEPFEALAFLADHKADSMHPDLTSNEQIEFLATGNGFIGTSLEYLENIVRQFSALSIVDEDCSALLLEAQAYSQLRKLPSSPHIA